MRNILFLLIVLLLAFTFNAEATTSAVPVQNAPKKCVPQCVNKHHKIKVFVTKTCFQRRISKCSTRKRCCKTQRRCLSHSFCKTTKRRCFWHGKAVNKCHRKRKVCKRVSHHQKIVVVRKHHKHHHRHGKHHKRHHKHHHRHGKHHKKHGKHHKKHHKHHHKKHIKITRKVLRKCSMVRFNPTTFKEKCCRTFLTFKNGKVSPKLTKIRCHWTKKVKHIHLKTKTICRLEKKGKCLRHKKCCNNVDGKSHCKFVGKVFRLTVGTCAPKPKITKKVKTTCHLKKVGKCSFQNKCCIQTTTCVNGKCRNSNRCGFRGGKIRKCKKPKITITYHTHCKNLLYKKCQNRLNCCVSKKTCTNGSCKTNKHCTWRGNVKVIRTGSCKIKVHRPVLAKPKHCSIYADPHITPFDNAVFNNQIPGDWVLYEGDNLRAHYRGVYHQGWYGWVGPTRFGVQLYNMRIFTTGFNFDHLIVNHKKIAIRNGKTQLGKGYVLKTNKKLVFSSGIGEDLTIQSLHWDQVYNLRERRMTNYKVNFINAWVSSNIPKTTGLCDHQFKRSSFFRSMKVLPPVVIKKVQCTKKVEFKNYCSNELGLKGELGKNCLFDLCNGMSKQQVLHIFKKNIKHKKDKPKIARTIVRACNIFADPHVTPFSGGMYNAQVLGDWVAYAGYKLEAHYRGNSHGSWVGIKEFGVTLCGHKIHSVGFNPSQLIIDGHQRSISSTLSVGCGQVKKSGNSLTFSTNDGEELTFTAYGYFYNLNVRSNVLNTRGLCNHQFIKSGFFTSSQNGHFVKVQRPTCNRRAQHRIKCQRRGLRFGRLHACIQDLCAGMRVKQLDNILHHIKIGFKKPIKCRGRLLRPIKIRRRVIKHFAPFKLQKRRIIRFVSPHIRFKPVVRRQVLRFRRVFRRRRW